MLFDIKLRPEEMKKCYGPDYTYNKFTPNVLGKLRQWLKEHNYPLQFKHPESGREYKVIYQKAVKKSA